MLQSIPAELLQRPVPARSPFTAPDGRLVQGSGLELRYVDARDGKPVPDVDLHYDLNRGERVKVISDAQGVVRIPFPKSEVKKLTTWGLKKGYATQSVIWRRSGDPLRLPATYTVKLYPVAPPVGGVVVNQDGVAVAVAEVSASHMAPTQRGGVFADVHSVNQTTKTDAKGRWQMQGLAEDLSGLRIKVAHPDYKTLGEIDYRMASGTGYGTLRDGTSRLVLAPSPSLSLSGIVVDENNKPLAGCEIVLAEDRRGLDPPTTTTGADGRFTLAHVNPKKHWLTAQASGHHPYVQEIAMPGKGDDLHIVLGKGRVLRARIVDENGKPLAGAQAIADRWRGIRTLDFRVSTDAEGRFEWHSAPADEVTFDLLGKNSFALRGLRVTASDTEQTLVLRPALTLIGTVVDARSSAPVKEFRITSGHKDKPEAYCYWENDRRSTFHDGRFEVRSEWMRFLTVLKIEADGYETLETSTFTPTQQTETVAVKLVPLAK